jgi:cytochrome c oxidase assembly protein subunit 15
MNLRANLNLFRKSLQTFNRFSLKSQRIHNRLIISKFSEQKTFTSDKKTQIDQVHRQTQAMASEQVTQYSIQLQEEFIKKGYDPRYVGWWLLLSSLGILGMILIGGYTRLSKSGLSMVKWKPVDPHLPRYV